MSDRPIAAMDFIDAAKATTPDATLLRDAGVELRGERCVTEEDVIRVAAEADVLLDGMGPITRRVLSSLPECKVVVRYGVGVDNVDLDAATDEGITVVNVPDYCVEEVSNHVITFLLAWAKQLAPLDECVRSGEWAERKRWPMDKVQSVHQQTLGVIGAGRIGLAAARKAKALAMEVLVFDPYIDEQKLTVEGLTPAGLDRVLAESDYVSVHTPLTDETRHLIGADALRAMKETAFLINVSRGPIVDEAALIAALEAGEIAGGGARRLRDGADRPRQPALHDAEHDPDAARGPLLATGHDPGPYSDRGRGPARSRRRVAPQHRQPGGEAEVAARLRAVVGGRGSRGLDVGECEVAAFEEERLSRGFRKGVREAVPEVQPRRVVTLAEPPPGPARGFRMVGGNRRQLDPRLFEKSVELVSGRGAAPAFEDDGCFQEVDDRHAAAWGLRNRPVVPLRILFAEEDGHERRRVDNHFGSPRSS